MQNAIKLSSILYLVLHASNKLTNTKIKKQNTYKNYQLQYLTINIKLIFTINEG